MNPLLRFVRLVVQRLLEFGQRLVVLLHFPVDQTEVIVRVGVIRVELERLPELFFGRFVLALLVVHEPEEVVRLRDVRIDLQRLLYRVHRLHRFSLLDLHLAQSEEALRLFLLLVAGLGPCRGGQAHAQRHGECRLEAPPHAQQTLQRDPSSIAAASEFPRRKARNPIKLNDFCKILKAGRLRTVERRERAGGSRTRVSASRAPALPLPPPCRPGSPGASRAPSDAPPPLPGRRPPLEIPPTEPAACSARRGRRRPARGSAPGAGEPGRSPAPCRRIFR